eukprot:scaffold308687_cov38-Prasinocladus_malaysianus.AAC.1
MSSMSTFKNIYEFNTTSAIIISVAFQPVFALSIIVHSAFGAKPRTHRFPITESPSRGRGVWPGGRQISTSKTAGPLISSLVCTIWTCTRKSSQKWANVAAPGPCEVAGV